MAWPHKLDVENSGVESVKGSQKHKDATSLPCLSQHGASAVALAEDDGLRMAAMQIKRVDFN